MKKLQFIYTNLIILIFESCYKYILKNANDYIKDLLINEFKKLQLNQLEIKTNIIKYKKPSTGQCYQIITWVKSKLFPNGFIHSKIVRKKDNKILQTFLL
jgi:hypothetical protein